MLRRQGASPGAFIVYYIPTGERSCQGQQSNMMIGDELWVQSSYVSSRPPSLRISPIIANHHC